MQVAREVGADFWTGGFVWHPTHAAVKLPHAAETDTSVVPHNLKLGLCQTGKEGVESVSVLENTMYIKWSNGDFPR